MAGGTRLRSLALFGALAATLAATAWVEKRNAAPDDFGPVAHAAVRQPDETVRPVPEGAAPAVETPRGGGAASDAQIDLARLKREIAPSGHPADDAFAKHTWYVPPPPPKPGPPPKPTAPPLPFKFMGRFTEGGKEVVFITNSQDRNFAVSRGDTIEGNYRVESITDRSMTLTYLPLGQQQTLPFPQ